ncbi:GNAT family N-acetyltransferase [Microbacterium sp. Marseille-Q6648]|uniref:GNAT family N-acetyltransferase n=1 Tax=Microbacterium sp. Marseille-Q6648 TaxID=2937991 RepID=UPI00203E8018|nr:GNAT family N-acetyltransferase [Microbacterium sp. Marseille-Q6648]
MTLTVRTAVRDDAAAIAQVRVTTWRAAYDGLIDDEVLAHMDEEREAARRRDVWDRTHADPRGAELVAELDGGVVGWAAYGPSVDEERPGSGQLFALYALASHWSTGVGAALLSAAERGLRDAGFTDAHLWVLEGNARAASFYERNGWREDGGVLVDHRTGADGRRYTLHERRRTTSLSRVR